MMKVVVLKLLHWIRTGLPEVVRGSLSPGTNPTHPQTTHTKPPHTTTNPNPNPTTTQGGDDCGFGCKEQDDMVPFPGNCHLYYHCMYDENGLCTVEQFDCGDWVFDPNVMACVWPELPITDGLCGGGY